jgi:trimethylamine--corrinoid protein Co-methyltransferase
MTESARPRRRRRDSPKNRAERDTAHYRRLVNPFTPLEVLSSEQVEQIHVSALDVLARDGIRVLLTEARRRFAAAGGAVDEAEKIVRLDPNLVAGCLAVAPPEFDLAPTGRDRGLTFGGRNVVMSPVAGPPHATDLENGRRAGTFEDLNDLLRLVQHYDVIHTTNPLVEPQDVPLEVRHLRVTHSQLTICDKAPFVYARGKAKVADCFEMIRIAHGIDEAEFTQVPRCYTVINTNSPRQIDVPMCLGIIQFAEANQALVVTPFTLAGAMAPVTIAGALTLQHAEALAGITLAQIVRAGAPVVYGGFTSNVDMRSGSPAFGTPEAVMAALASGQLARYIGLPWRSSAVSTSNVPDAQSGYETMMSMMGAVLGGANQIIHAVGWLESGLAASFEKFILDVEMVQMFAELFQPLALSEADIGVDAISSVAPGGHFFEVDHTMERFATAFYSPVVFSRQNFEQWSEEGALTAAQRATGVWKQVLADFEPPPVDESIRAQLDDFVARRTAEGGAPPED